MVNTPFENAVIWPSNTPWPSNILHTLLPIKPAPMAASVVVATTSLSSRGAGELFGWQAACAIAGHLGA